MARAPTTSDAFNAVAEPRRRQILDLLASGERPVGDVVASLAQPAPVTREAPKPGTGVTLDNLRALKELLGKVGADNLKDLIDIMK